MGVRDCNTLRKNNVFLRKFSCTWVSTWCFSGVQHQFFTQWWSRISWKFAILIKIWHFAKSGNLIIFCKKVIQQDYVKYISIMFSSVNFYVHYWIFNVFHMWHASFSSKWWHPHFVNIFNFGRKLTFCKLYTFHYFLETSNIHIVCTLCKH